MLISKRKLFDECHRSQFGEAQKNMKKNMAELRIPKTFYTYRGKLYFTWRASHELYHHKTLDQEWESLEESAVFIGFDPEIHGWFTLSGDNYYDGHTCHYITIFGLTIGKLYTWQAQPCVR